MVATIIQMTSSEKSGEERTRHVASCLYLSYLIRLHQSIGGRVRCIAPSTLGQFPQSVQTDLMEKFTSVGVGAASWKSAAKLTVTALHKDSLLSRIAVLLLMLSGRFAFNVGKAMQELGAGVTQAKLISICKALGCRVDSYGRTGEQICVLEKPPRPRSALLQKQKQRFSK